MLFYIYYNLPSYSRRRPLRSPIPVVYVKHRRLIHSSLCQLNVSPNRYWQYSNSTSINTQWPIFIVSPLLRQQSTYADKRSYDNSIWIKMCLSPKDVNTNETSAPTDPILSYHKYKRSNCTLIDIKKKAYELFDTIEHLEYYDDTEHNAWRPINDIPNNEFLQTFIKGRILHLRIPEYFDSFMVGDIDDDDDNNNAFSHDDEFGFDSYDSPGFSMAGNDDDLHNLHTADRDTNNTNNTNTDYQYTTGSTGSNWKTSPERLMEKTIRSLLQQLKENGFIRSKIKPMSLHNLQSQDEILTKEWLLRECHQSDKLRSTILRNTNSFNHIVQCLHYDFLWKDIK